MKHSEPSSYLFFTSHSPFRSYFRSFSRKTRKTTLLNIAHFYIAADLFEFGLPHLHRVQHPFQSIYPPLQTNPLFPQRDPPPFDLCSRRFAPFPLLSLPLPDRSCHRRHPQV